MLRKIISLITALALFAGPAAALAEGSRAEIPFTVTGADRLREETGAASGTAPEEIMANARENGLAHPLAEEDLLSAGARILREDGMIYMIRSLRGLRKARTAEEAAETAWSLVRLLGADADLELELYARLDIGSVRVYGFCQFRDGEPLYGRVLKIIAGADGDVNTVISSLAFPEETDETLGASEDLLARMTEDAETPDLPDFTRMKRGEYSCAAEGAGGETLRITVPVMQDPETGLWFLADPERKIAAGDFRQMVLEGRKDCLLSSPDNSGWNPADVLAYHRIIQCRDFFGRRGLNGPDGEGTPVLLLTNLCLATGEPMDNACYIGLLGEQWQTFACGRETEFGRCLDILAHEYVHCLTETSAPGSLYKDDYGAISEGLSDILGNICEMKLEETDDTEWYMGENLGAPFRAMGSPHEFSQPEYVWDLYYAPKALFPNDANDRGGVHTNSSILNYTASRLCMDSGMTLEEALDFWLAVDLGLSPRTDYFQMADLMDWALETVGLAQYRGALRALTEKTQMTRTARPETLPEGQMRVDLRLPDTEAMKDHGWTLMAVQLRVRESLDLVLDMLAGSGEENGDAPSLDDLMELLASEETSGSNWESPETAELMNRLRGVFSVSSSWVSEEGAPMTMVLGRGMPTLYLLMNMDLEAMEPRTMALLAGGEWIDLGSLSVPEADESNDEAAMALLGKLGGMVLDLLMPPDAEVIGLPAAGLENITLSLPAPERD